MQQHTKEVKTLNQGKGIQMRNIKRIMFAALMLGVSTQLTGQGFTPGKTIDSNGVCWTTISTDGSWSYSSLQAVRCEHSGAWNNYYSGLRRAQYMREMCVLRADNTKQREIIESTNNFSTCRARTVHDQAYCWGIVAATKWTEVRGNYVVTIRAANPGISGSRFRQLLAAARSAFVASIRSAIRVACVFEWDRDMARCFYDRATHRVQAQRDLEGDKQECNIKQNTEQKSARGQLDAVIQN